MTAKEIRKELAKRRKFLISTGIKETAALNQARREMNEKYGHTWRDEPYLSKQNCRSV